MRVTVHDSATVYSGVHIIGSAVAEHATIGDNTDLLDSSIGAHAQIGRRNLVIASTIGEGTYTGSNDVVSNAAVGKYCSVSWNVGLGGGNHDYRAASMLTDHYWKKILDVDFASDGRREKTLGGGCVIGSDVWIAQGAIVVSGVTVGDGAVIGANATVLKDVPPYAVVVGTPARVVKYRFDPETVERLLRISWWDWDRETIRENAGLLRGRLSEGALRTLEGVAVQKGARNGSK